jgi:hypothetical protein
MTTQEEQIRLRQQLVLLTDAYITLSDNPAWQVLADQYPELETARQSAVQATDLVWWQYRTKLVVSEK